MIAWLFDYYHSGPNTNESNIIPSYYHYLRQWIRLIYDFKWADDTADVFIIETIWQWKTYYSISTVLGQIVMEELLFHQSCSKPTNIIGAWFSTVIIRQIMMEEWSLRYYSAE